MGVVERLESTEAIKEIHEHLMLLGFRGDGMDRAASDVVTFCRTSWIAASLEQMTQHSLDGINRENTIDTYEQLLPSYFFRIQTKQSDIYTELAQVFAEYMRTAYR